MSRKSAYTMIDRLAALAVALVFAVPTAFFLWLAVNLGLAPLGGFLGSFWLWGTIAVFALVSLVSPDVFIYMLGAVWKAIYRFGRWF